MPLDVSWYQANSALRALSTLMMTVMVICTVVLPIKPGQCFNARRQRFSDYDELLSVIENEREKQQRRQQLRPTEASTDPAERINATSSSEILSYAKASSHDMVERILSSEDNDTSAAAESNAPTDSSHQLVEINLTAVRDELLRELNSEAVTVQADTNISRESIRTVPEQKFREALERVLQRHLELARKKLGSTESPSTDNPSRQHTTGVSLSSQLICQFFIFGTLFGVVCSISTCTCCLQPRADRRRSSQLSGVNPTNVPAPIDYSKPYMIKCDSRGSCYASPLNDDEVPPLPTYNIALTCPTQPLPTTQQSSTN